ncbi:MAG: hypothetical protein GYB19_16050 [Rhodospirillales bacterium]|nr:hypothetical protein [Rhodospirillales bacterium]
MVAIKSDIASEMKRAMSAGQFDQAAKIGARILRLHPKRTDIEIMTAVSELQTGWLANAGRRLKRLFHALPLTDRFFAPVAQNFRQYAYQSNDFAALETAIRRRLGTEPGNGILAYMLADAIFQDELIKSPGVCVAPRLAEAIDALVLIPAQSAQ